MRRMISTPLSSSPWMAAETNSTGPSSEPLMTCTGIIMGNVDRQIGDRQVHLGPIPRSDFHNRQS